MYIDLLDILRPHGKFVCTGSYYKRRPISLSDGASIFNYEYVSAYSSTWRRLYGNIQAESGEVTIRTAEWLPNLKPKQSFVVLQDGKLFCVTQADKDFTAAPQQVLRLFQTPIFMPYVLRLIEVENPWGIK